MELTKEQKETVNSIIEDHFDIHKEDISEDTMFVSDLGFDSLDFVELIIEIEIEFDISISIDVGVSNTKSIKDFYGVIASQLKG